MDVECKLFASNLEWLSVITLAIRYLNKIENDYLKIKNKDVFLSYSKIRNFESETLWQVISYTIRQQNEQETIISPYCKDSFPKNAGVRKQRGF